MHPYAANGSGKNVLVLGGAGIAMEIGRPRAAFGTWMTWRTSNDTGSLATSTCRGGGAKKFGIGAGMTGYRMTAQVWSGDSPATTLRV